MAGQAQHLHLKDVSKQILNALKFHDVIHVDIGPEHDGRHPPFFVIMKVRRGWLYFFPGAGSVFVPKPGGGGN